MNTTSIHDRIVPPGEGRKFAALGVTITIKASTAATGGAITLVEYSAPPKFAGPPLHFRKRLTETFYIRRRTMTFTLEDEKFEAGQGTCVVAPPNFVHGFANNADQLAEFLVVFQPGGMEAYFEELFALLNAAGGFPTLGNAKFDELAHRFDTYAPQEK